MKSRTLKWFAAMTLFAALAAPTQLAAQKQTHYTVTFLGTLGGTFSQPFGLNNKGEVNGIATLPGDNETHAILWRNGVLTDLGTLGGPNSNGDAGVPFGPNERGEVVGAAETSTPTPGEDFCFLGNNLVCLPFVWRNGVMTPLPTLGGNNGGAGDINNRGQVVGIVENTTPESDCFNILQQAKPVLWEKGEIHELPIFPGDTDGGANAINDLGQIVGTSGGCQSGPTFALHGLLWQNGALTDLGNLGGMQFTLPAGINNLGQVVGVSDLPGDTFPGHAFLWTKDSGIQNLGTLPGDISSIAKDINDKGQIVGQSTDASGNSRAFIWQNGLMTDLNTLVPGGGSTLFLFEAFGINLRGQFAVVGFDVNSGNCCAFLATPANGGAENESATAMSPGQSSQSSMLALPENVRKMLRQRLGVRYRSPDTATPQAVLVSAPNAALSPTSLTFSTQAIGTTSAAKIVTFKNTGTTSLTISAIAIAGTNTGDFSQTHNCGSSLAAGASCFVSLTFKPAGSGTRTAALRVTDNAVGSPQQVTVSGIGTTAKLSPVSLSFLTQAIGTTSAAMNVTLTNVGTTSFTITSIAVSGNNPGDFAQTHTCGSSQAAGASCIISVAFKPTASGARSAALSVTDNAAGSPQHVALGGTGTTAKLFPTSLNFGTVATGTTSPAKGVTLTNVGATAISIAGIVITGTNAGDFAQTHSCGSSLGPGATCSISITFKPTASGTRIATLSVSDNAAGSPQTVTLNGNCFGGKCGGVGQQCGAPQLSPCCPGLVCVPASTRAFCEP